MSRTQIVEQAPPPPKINGVKRDRKSFNETFRRIASASAAAVGSKWAFLLSILIVIVWAATGPMFKFSDTWQLVINTGTTIVTFLMVFLIQNTQNRDAKAIHLKLDELIRGVHGARTHLVNLEEFSDEELEALQKQFARLQSRAEKKVNHRLEEVDDTAREAHRKAETAEDTSEAAHDAAARAHRAAEEARRTAADAHEHARRADERTSNGKR